MTKTRQDNNVINSIGVIYIETEIELLGPIKTSVISNENQTKKKRCDRDHTNVVYIENKIELS